MLADSNMSYVGSLPCRNRLLQEAFSEKWNVIGRNKSSIGALAGSLQGLVYAYRRNNRADMPCAAVHALSCLSYEKWQASQTAKHDTHKMLHPAVQPHTSETHTSPVFLEQPPRALPSVLSIQRLMQGTARLCSPASSNCAAASLKHSSYSMRFSAATSALSTSSRYFSIALTRSSHQPTCILELARWKQSRAL